MLCEASVRWVRAWEKSDLSLLWRQVSRTRETGEGCDCQPGALEALKQVIRMKNEDRVNTRNRETVTCIGKDWEDPGMR